MTEKEFNNKIKSALDQFEIDNVTPDWDAFEKKLDASQKKKKPFGGFYVAAAIGILAGLTFVYHTDDYAITQTSTQPNNQLSETKINNSDNNTTSQSQPTSEIKQTDLNKPEVVESVSEKESVKTSISASEENNLPSNRIAHEAQTSQDDPEDLKKKETTKGKNDLSPEDDNNLQSSIDPQVQLEIISNKDWETCIGNEIQFTTNDNCNCSYIWDFGDGTLAYKKLVRHSYDAPGDYPVKVTITDKETHNVRYTASPPVKVFANPVVAIEDDLPRWNECSFDYNFTAVGTVEKQTWYIDEQIVSTDKSFARPLLEKGEYNIKLKAENNHGCVATETKTISVESDFNLGAKSGFIPGVSEPWMPKGLECIEPGFSLTIYNMDGIIVFESDDYNNKWTGTINGSANIAQPTETFAWTASYKTLDGKIRKAKGVIVIMPNH